MADVAIRTEDWRTLPWKQFQRNVFRLQKRISVGSQRPPHPRQPFKGCGARQCPAGVSATCNGCCCVPGQRCSQCGLRFTTEDVLEVHHGDGNHANNDPPNLVLLHAHCHDVAHSKRC